VHTVAVPNADGHGEVDYTVVRDLPSLVWAANLGTIEFHVPLWCVAKAKRLPGPPDFMVFDLDPGEGTTLVECCQVALLIHEDLEARSVATRVKTSGAKGLQVYASLVGRPSWEKSRTAAHDMALALERRHPELVVSNMRKTLRRDKVLIDWSQNHPAKTTVSAYSVRARPRPTVSTPVTWKEVQQCVKSGDPTTLEFTTSDVLTRIKKRGDLFSF
jgi:bifunctional non-homologous end joining protein LigD